MKKTKPTQVGHERKLRAIKKKIEAGLVEAMSVLPKAAVMFEAIPFFAAFTAVFERISLKEKAKVMDEILNEVAIAGIITQSGLIDITRALWITIAHLLKNPKNKEELFKKIKSSIPKTLEKFEEEYERIIRAWNK
jgi:hypothetical protein